MKKIRQLATCGLPETGSLRAIYWKVAKKEREGGRRKKGEGGRVFISKKKKLCRKAMK